MAHLAPLALVNVMTLSQVGSHPDLGHLALLVFEAVLEVVCIALPGYVVAALGHFDHDKQKFVANLNLMLFTPCLIFTKLASQLNSQNLSELAIIPIIFVLQTCISWLVSILVSRAFRFGRRPTNFVTAMAVFGNSNSLPISLVFSLSQTLEGLRWDKIPGDNADEVASRGILYIMVFQQLGQLVRWSWGYHVLLAPRDKHIDSVSTEFDRDGPYYDDPDHLLSSNAYLIPGLDGQASEVASSVDSDQYEPAGRTPVIGTSRESPIGSDDCDSLYNGKPLRTHPADFGSNVSILGGNDNDILSFPRICAHDDIQFPAGIPGVWLRARLFAARKVKFWRRSLARRAHHAYDVLPPRARRCLDYAAATGSKTNSFVWEFMNPPLWAMLAAVLVASMPALQRLFFEEGSFVKNSVTSAIKSSAGVAVPLILVVLGGNLARSSIPRETVDVDEDEAAVGSRKLLVASLVSRMLLPTLLMAPILALMAKWVPISILDDPIFIVVCFLLVGAPSALQLAQICQINGVYEGVMSSILFQSYVIWILPSTLVLVTCALKVVEWANVG